MKRVICLSMVLSGCATGTVVTKAFTTATETVRATPGSVVWTDIQCSFITNVRTVAFDSAIKKASFAESHALCRDSQARFSVACTEACFSQTFYYYGQSKGATRFLYRESDDRTVARFPFDLVLEYDSNNKVITFRDKRMLVEGLDEEAIVLRFTPSKR